MRSLIVALFLLFGCSDDSGVTVVRYDKSLQTVPCLRLLVFSPDTLLETTLQKLYSFDENCSYTLQASQKCAITCNSNQNADKKALGVFPSGYLRLDIYKAGKVRYSYYKDTQQEVDKTTVEEAFTRVSEDILK